MTTIRFASTTIQKTTMTTTPEPDDMTKSSTPEPEIATAKSSLITTIIQPHDSVL